MHTADPARPSASLLQQWPLPVVLALVWGALWQDFSLHVLLTGFVIAVVVMLLFPMPRIPFSGRLNPWWALVFTVAFIADVVRSSLSVARTVLLRRDRVRGSVVEVRLRSHDDIVITLVSHALALVPGSIVLDVDRAHGALYLHLLDITADAEIEEYRAKALRVEAGIIRAVGSREDVALLERHPDEAPPEEELEEHRRHPVYRTEQLPDTPGGDDAGRPADAATADHDPKGEKR